MAKGKPKIDLKDFLLRKGEYLAMGFAGFCLVIMLFWGVSKWGSAKDPDEITKELASKSAQVKNNIVNGTPNPDDEKSSQLPEWLNKPSPYTRVKPNDFPFTGPVFDTTAQPNTKRENPLVLSLGEYQIDLIRGGMPGYDIIYTENGKPEIAVMIAKATGKLDDAKLKSASDALKRKGQVGGNNRDKLNNNRPQNPGGGPMPPGGGGPMPPGGGVPPGGGGLVPPGGPGGAPPLGTGSPHGLQGDGAYDAGGKRIEKTIKYIPLDEIDAAIAEKQLPAVTVIPMRLVVIHAVVPYKQQLNEIKRALRLATDAEAKQWGPWYDGFEVQRRETRMLPNGQVIVIQDWPEPSKDPKNTDGNYKFEERYIDKIDTRKIGDNFDEGYFPYFLKPEMMLSMPLPLLAKDLKATYPEVRLKAITDNIAKLNEKNKPKLTASDLAKQLSGAKPKSSIYKPQTNNSDNFGFDPKTFGGTSFPGGGMPPGIGMPPGGGGIVPPGGVVPPGGGGAVPPGTGGTPKLPDGYSPNSGVAIPDEVENFLLRFVDCDVELGRTYEYRIRLRMHNPNTGQDKWVANPEFAKKAYETLYSKWTQIDTPITLPAESFLYAYDVKNFRDQTAAAFDSQKELLNRMQVKDNQAVVQLATWMGQVRTDGTKREPVGAWVVTEIPVGRGEYIGRKQYVKLPLWSSEIQQYMLREVNDKVIVGPKGAGKEVQQPKGWLVDFSTNSILVDFEGGRVKTKMNVAFDQKGNLIQQQRTVEEDAATEMLIVRSDGKLVVRNSLTDETDDNRKEISSKWAEWVKAVEGRKSAATGTNEPNPFDPKKP